VIARFLPLLALTACYTYRPLPSPELPVGTRLSVQLTDEGSRELWSQIGPDVLNIEGELVTIDSSALRVSVRQVDNRRGIQNDWKGEQVMIPRRDVVGVQQRRLSLGGTALLATITAGAMYALYSALHGAGVVEGDPGSGNPQGPK